LAALMVGLAACSTIRPLGGDDAPRLAVQLTGVNRGERGATVTGMIVNKLDQPVTGVRYVVTVYDTATPPKELARYHREVAATVLQPGDRRPFTLDLGGSGIGGGTNSRVGITATPMKLGVKAFPPPDGWDSAD
jgi:hypothetical protein